MKLLDIVQRAPTPIPWQEGDNIPWHEPEFSARMLAEHLTQAHDRASRRSSLIEHHVEWIHRVLLQGKPTRILDLGCGPGLYSNRLATLGHTCFGVDYSPASIIYAKNIAQQSDLTAAYLHEDMRVATYGEHYGLAILLFGELNVFSQADATKILTKTFDALAPGGLLLLEPHTYTSLINNTPTPATWFSSSGGLFSPRPHLVLIEEHLEPTASIVTRRYYVMDAATSEITRYAQSFQAYTPAEYEHLLTRIGFHNVRILPGLAHDRTAPAPDFHAIVAAKPSAPSIH